MHEMVCARCPRREACPGTRNQTCLSMALELVAELADRNARLQELFDAAMSDLTTHHPEGRCSYCRYTDDPPVISPDDIFEIPARCRECKDGSNWAWRVEM